MSKKSEVHNTTKLAHTKAAYEAAFASCCGGRIRTGNLKVMSLASYRCSTPRYFEKDTRDLHSSTEKSIKAT